MYNFMVNEETFFYQASKWVGAGPDTQEATVLFLSYLICNVGEWYLSPKGAKSLLTKAFLSPRLLLFLLGSVPSTALLWSCESAANRNEVLWLGSIYDTPQYCLPLFSANSRMALPPLGIYLSVVLHFFEFFTHLLSFLPLHHLYDLSILYLQHSVIFRFFFFFN